MAQQLDTVILIALPASGKSEVRRYLASLSEEQCRNEFHIGPTVQLDDFPYVHLMRRTDEVLGKLGAETLFFGSSDEPFKDPIDWGTLIHLLNQDYANLHANDYPDVPSAAEHLFERIDAAREACGGAQPYRSLSAEARATVADALEPEVRDLYDTLKAARPESLEGKTIVIEFARGGPDGSSMPLPAPYGYAYSLGQLSEQILSRSSLLYVWVTPEESRRKNTARTDPNDPGSILHHGVPMAVMLGEYGCDDIDHLLSQSDKPNTIRVAAHGETFELALGRFDNRVDKTSFIRKDRADWGDDEVKAIHDGLKEAFDALAAG